MTDTDIVERLSTRARAANGDGFVSYVRADLLTEAAAEITRLRTQAPLCPEGWEKYIPDIVKNAMLTTWNEICSDTSCHPLDIKHGRGKYLTFEPRHWAQHTGEMVADQIPRLLSAAPPAPASTGEAPRYRHECSVCGAAGLNINVVQVSPSGGSRKGE